MPGPTKRACFPCCTAGRTHGLYHDGAPDARREREREMAQDQQLKKSSSSRQGPAYLPWPCIQLALVTKRDAIEAVVAALPCMPRLVTTPPLLALLSGHKWPSTVISTRLIRLYLAVLYHVRADTRWTGPHFEAVDEALARDQEAAFRDENVGPGAGNEGFTLAYLHAYEAALVKVLHLFRPDATPNPAIVALDPDEPATAALRALFTPRVLSRDNSKELEDEGRDIEELRANLLKTTLRASGDIVAADQAALVEEEVSTVG